MAIAVYSNIPGLNAQRNLTNNGAALSKSLERLSSGLRINRAADDAAGLAISEGLRAQVRGLNQAVRNANDGVSVAGTAEGALSESTSLLQRIRELAVQAASDTNSAANRTSLQGEVDQAVAELGRIAGTMEFNGLKLFDGTFSDKQIQVGAFSNQTISISIADMRVTRLGAVATTTGTAVDTINGLSAGDLVLSGTTIGAASDDGTSFQNSSASAIAMATAINAQSGTTGVKAFVNESSVVANQGTVTAITMDGTDNSLTINGINIGAVSVQTNDSDDALVSRINAYRNSTGVVASVENGELTLTAADGRNVTVETTGSVGGNLGFTANQATNLSGGATTVLTGGAGMSGTTASSGATITITGSTGTSSALSINSLNLSSAGGRTSLLTAINGATGTTGVTASISTDLKLVLTDSANGDVRVSTAGTNTGSILGLTATGNASSLTAEYGTTGGTITLRGDSFSLGGNNPSYAGFTAGGYGTDLTTSITNISVRTRAGANAAIQTVDVSLQQVNEARADLGALTNRLESTIRNLSATSENLAASDSRIRDADFAAETAGLMRAQILQQAGVAILAQANVLPQAALSLLG